MKVLVTGGSGFIGSAVVDELIAAGHQPFVVDRLIREWTKVSYKQTDIRYNIGREFMGFDAIIHMAASHIVSESVKLPIHYYDNNINSLLSMIECKPKKFIYSSSAAVYGIGPNFTEESTTNPIHPYGRSKLWGEQILEDSGLDYVCLRYFNAAGAGVNHGYVQEPRTHAIPILMDCLHNNKPFTVFGKQLDTRDGTCERDYTDVRDLARAHVAALEYNGQHRVFNVGSGAGTTMLELINATENITKKKLNWKFGEARSYDPPSLVADISLIKKELGWKPIYNLDDIVHNAWRWEIRNGI